MTFVMILFAQLFNIWLRYSISGSLISKFSWRACPQTPLSTKRTRAKVDVATPIDSLKGGRVMIAFFVNYSTVAFPLHLPTLKRQQFFGAVANSLGKNSYFPLPLDVRRCVAPTGEEVDARQRGVN